MEISERLKLIIEEAHRRVMSQPRSYIGDPDLMSEETLKLTMRLQDQAKVDAEVINILRQL